MHKTVYRLIIFDENVIAGSICWYDAIESFAEFEPVWCDEEHRKNGLASASMLKTMKILKAYGLDKVYVRTEEDNYPAINLYKKLGFKTVHKVKGWEMKLT